MNRYSMKTYGGVDKIDRFFELRASWRSVVIFTPWPLYPRRKSPRYPLERRLGGSQNRSVRHGDSPGLELRPLSRPAHTDCAVPAPTSVNTIMKVITVYNANYT
jgi:hypothetical protein